MTRLMVVSAALLAMVGSAHAHVRFAADFSVQPYLDNRSLGVQRGAPVYIPPRPTYRRPVARPSNYPPVQHAAPPVPIVPVPRHEQVAPPHAPEHRREYVVPAAPPPASAAPVVPTPAVQPPAAAEATPAPEFKEPPAAPPSTSPFLAFLLFLLTGGCVAAAAIKGIAAPGAAAGAVWRAASGKEPLSGTPRITPAMSGTAMAGARRATSVAAETGIPSQEGWARRAGKVRGPVRGFVFRFQARANARALDEEQQRMKKARGMTKEYTGMLNDLAEGEEAATAYAVRRELAGEHYEDELAQQREAFDEAAHRRGIAGKRRQTELTEADTRRIEAAHEREATEKFKDAKFALGFARFEEKQKGHRVGSASAEAAIAETKTSSEPPNGANESEEVVQLYGLLQSTMAAIEEGERLGRDTQALRERVDLYKKLLRL